jgi:hypothetical protein
MKRLLAILAAAGLLLTFTPAAPAQAVDQGWRFKTGMICVETHGWTRWPLTDAARRWDTSPDIHVFALADCSAYPATQRVTLRVYYSSEYACAKTGSIGGYTWEYVYRNGVRVAAWTPKAMTLWMNMWPGWFNQCHATAGQRAHIASHELGHALGLAHRTGASVMASWAYQWPTAADIYDANGLY